MDTRRTYKRQKPTHKYVGDRPTDSLNVEMMQEAHLLRKTCNSSEQLWCCIINETEKQTPSFLDRILAVWNANPHRGWGAYRGRLLSCWSLKGNSAKRKPTSHFQFRNEISSKCIDLNQFFPALVENLSSSVKDTLKLSFMFAIYSLNHTFGLFKQEIPT